MNRSITLKGVVTRELRAGNDYLLIIYVFFGGDGHSVGKRGDVWVLLDGRTEGKHRSDVTHTYTLTQLRVEPEVRHHTCRLLLLSSLPSDHHRAFILCVILPQNSLSRFRFSL